MLKDKSGINLFQTDITAPEGIPDNSNKAEEVHRNHNLTKNRKFPGQAADAVQEQLFCTQKEGDPKVKDRLKGHLSFL